MRLVRTQKFITFILAVLLTSALIGMPLIEAQNLKPSPTNQLQVKGLTSSTVGDSRYYEASDNGANYVGFKAPTTLAGNVTWQLPATDNAGVFTSDGNGVVTLAAGGGVTSVGLSMPAGFTVANSPVTSSGTLTVTRTAPSPVDFILKDEFGAGTNVSGSIGELNWGALNIAGTSVFSNSNVAFPHTGVLQISTGSTDNDGGALVLSTAGGSFQSFIVLSAITFDAYFIYRTTSVADIVQEVGFATAAAFGSQGIYIRFDTDQGDTKFTFVCKDGSGTQAITTNSINADALHHTFRIRSTTPGTILFSIDGGTETSINQNVPTSAGSFCFKVGTRVGATSKVMQADYFSFYTAVSR